MDIGGKRREPRRINVTSGYFGCLATDIFESSSLINMIFYLNLFNFLSSDII